LEPLQYSVVELGVEVGCLLIGENCDQTRSLGSHRYSRDGSRMGVVVLCSILHEGADQLDRDIVTAGPGCVTIHNVRLEVLTLQGSARVSGQWQTEPTSPTIASAPNAKVKAV